MLLSGQDADDQDPVVVVVRSAQGMLREGLGEADSAAFESAFAAQYTAKSWPGIFDLLLGNAPVIFKKVASVDETANPELSARIAKTAEGYFEVVLSMLSKLDSVEAVVARIDAFIAAMLVASPSTPVSSLKLKLLVTLFHSISPKAELRLTIVKGMCKFAQSNGKMANQVFALVKDCPAWIHENEWELTNAAKAEVFGLVRSVASPEEGLRFLSLEADVADAAEAKRKLTEQLAVESVRIPSVVRFAGLTAVSPAVSKCLSILLSGKFADMEAFVASTDGTQMLSANKLSKDELLDKMRVVSIASFGSTKSVVRVSIDQIGKELKTADPVTVVVKAIRAGLVTGSIDEVQGVVVISGCAGADWKHIKADAEALLKRIGGQ